MLTGSSGDADATSLPSGENATALTQSEWLLSVRRAAPVAESQSLTVLSCDADATSLPSGENATALTQSEWLLSVRRAAPVAESQSLTVLSCDADATSLPSTGLLIAFCIGWGLTFSSSGACRTDI